MNNMTWHKFEEHPPKEGFYLSVLKMEETNQYFYDITPFKDGQWKFRKSLIPVDISNLNGPYEGRTIKFIKWTQLSEDYLSDA